MQHLGCIWWSGLSYAAAVVAAYAACRSFVAVVQTLSLNAWQTHGDVHTVRLVPAVVYPYRWHRKIVWISLPVVAVPPTSVRTGARGVSYLVEKKSVETGTSMYSRAAMRRPRSSVQNLHLVGWHLSISRWLNLENTSSWLTVTKNKFLACDVRIYTPEGEASWIRVSFHI